MDKEEALLDKARKLLAKATDPATTESESMAFYEKAGELLDRIGFENIVFVNRDGRPVPEWEVRDAQQEAREAQEREAREREAREAQQAQQAKEAWEAWKAQQTQQTQQTKQAWEAWEAKQTRQAREPPPPSPPGNQQGFGTIALGIVGCVVLTVLFAICINAAASYSPVTSHRMPESASFSSMSRSEFERLGGKYDEYFYPNGQSR